MRAHVDERLRYFATTVQQVRARRTKASARGAMEEKSLIEQMRPYAGVLTILEDGSEDDIVERYIEQASRRPWMPS
ncbi:MAG TPA: hypothetical protein VJ818_07310 [Actinomycetota bacterium]|nr:hypothetical protein [Actinomycetota bacterium]